MTYAVSESECDHPEDALGPLPFESKAADPQEWECSRCGHWNVVDGATREARATRPLPATYTKTPVWTAPMIEASFGGIDVRDDFSRALEELKKKLAPARVVVELLNSMIVVPDALSAHRVALSSRAIISVWLDATTAALDVRRAASIIEYAAHKMRRRSLSWRLTHKAMFALAADTSTDFTWRVDSSRANMLLGQEFELVRDGDDAPDIAAVIEL